MGALFIRVLVRVTADAHVNMSWPALGEMVIEQRSHRGQYHRRRQHHHSTYKPIHTRNYIPPGPVPQGGVTFIYISDFRRKRLLC